MDGAVVPIQGGFAVFGFAMWRERDSGTMEKDISFGNQFGTSPWDEFSQTLRDEDLHPSLGRWVVCLLLR